jgi:predicted phage terminase large subunit-like protein
MANEFKPCSARQSEFLKSNATVTVFGGSRGSAKTYGGLLRHLRWVHEPRYVGYVIRKNEKILRDGGGAFQEACVLYRLFEPRIKVTSKPMRITFPSGATIDFQGFGDDRDMDKYRGKQLSGIMCDEGNQLEEKHVDMLMSCMRTSSKMNPNIWITCNPDPHSYLFKWVEWYLYPKGAVVDGELVEGRPDPAKNGKLIWMIRVNGTYVFDEDRNKLIDDYNYLYDGKADPISFRFIGATVYDNPPLLKNNPTYLAQLLGLPRVQKERDLFGNWVAVDETTGYFKKAWVGDLLHTVPLDVVRRVRCWDFAASIPSEVNPDPDWTVGVLMSRNRDDKFIIEDVARFRKRHGEVLQEVIRVAREDQAFYGDVQCFIPEDAGQAGKVAATYAVNQLAMNGIGAKLIKVGSVSKLNRFKPFAASAEVGSVRVVQAKWNHEFFYELEAFDGTRKSIHDDRHTCRQ